MLVVQTHSDPTLPLLCHDQLALFQIALRAACLEAGHERANVHLTLDLAGSIPVLFAASYSDVLKEVLVESKGAEC